MERKRRRKLSTHSQKAQVKESKVTVTERLNERRGKLTFQAQVQKTTNHRTTKKSVHSPPIPTHTHIHLTLLPHPHIIHRHTPILNLLITRPRRKPRILRRRKIVHRRVRAVEPGLGPEVVREPAVCAADGYV